MHDEQIIRLYEERNELAIPATSQKYGNYCTSIAKNILGGPEDAEECVNDVYFSAWNSIPPHRPAVLSAYLGKLTRNLAINRYRKDRADKRGGGELPQVLEELAECVSGTDDVERELDRQELIGAINAFLGGLPEKRRNLFIWRYWYAESVGAIAEHFKLTAGGVSVQLSRTRAQLGAYLEERGFER